MYCAKPSITIQQLTFLYYYCLLLFENYICNLLKKQSCLFLFSLVLEAQLRAHCCFYTGDKHGNKSGPPPPAPPPPPDYQMDGRARLSADHFVRYTILPGFSTTGLAVAPPLTYTTPPLPLSLSLFCLLL